jgi:predicted transcriptional regulator
MWGKDPVRLSLRPRGGKGEPYADDVVAQVRELVEETRLSQKEIGAIVGVSHTCVSNWTRSGGWKRPPGTARPLAEQSDRLKAMKRRDARTRAWQLLKEAEALVGAIEAGGKGLARLEHAMSLVRQAAAASCSRVETIDRAV